MGKNIDKRDLKRSALSGRIINGRDVILTDEAIEYVKKMGYNVYPNEKKEVELIIKSFFMTLGLMASFALFLIPLVSAEPLWAVDFTSRINIVLMVILFVLALAFFILKQYILSGFIFLVSGFILALNGINSIISLIVVSLGVIVITKEGK